MPFHHPLGFALLACALAAAGGCQRESPFPAPASSSASSTAPAPPSPDEMVRARAPRDELAFLDGKLAFAKGADGAAAATPQSQADRAAAWKKIVLGVGEFKDWIGYTKAIDGKGRIEIILSDGLIIFTGTPKDSRLFNVVESLSENSQLVIISGRFSPSFLGASEVSDDPRFPTCFENRFGLTGCEVELTNIAPLR